MLLLFFVLSFLFNPGEFGSVRCFPDEFSNIRLELQLIVGKRQVVQTNLKVMDIFFSLFSLGPAVSFFWLPASSLPGNT